MKRIILSFIAALTLLVGTAVPAQALTVVQTSDCRWVQVVASPPYMGYFCWTFHNYNWWEETFLGKRDYWSQVLVKRAYLY